ncbi:hypothetical protein [Alistipes sp.]|uniref:hypothetical protein n=1 Tax=Alistipes sp. TaxID=1872444 RepID=UPI003AB160F7
MLCAEKTQICIGNLLFYILSLKKEPKNCRKAEIPGSHARPRQNGCSALLLREKVSVFSRSSALRPAPQFQQCGIRRRVPAANDLRTSSVGRFLRRFLQTQKAAIIGHPTTH